MYILPAIFVPEQSLKNIIIIGNHMFYINWDFDGNILNKHVPARYDQTQWLI